MAGLFPDVFALLEGEFGTVKEADEVKKNQKTQAEIDQFTLSESLDDVHRVVHLLTKGTLAQQTSAVDLYRSLVVNSTTGVDVAMLKDPLECITATVQAPDVPVNHRTSLLNCICDILDAGVVPVTLVSSLIAPVACKLVLRYKADDVYTAVTKLFVRCLKYVALDLVVREIVPAATLFGSVSSTDTRRVACCHVLGAVAALPAVHTDVIMGYSSTLLTLCQDTLGDVRQAVCEQLPILFKRLVDEDAITRLTSELIELLNDEEAAVKVAAIRSAVDSLAFLPTDVRRVRVLPPLRSLYQSASRAFTSSSAAAAALASSRLSAAPVSPALSLASPTAAVKKSEAVLRALCDALPCFFQSCSKLGDFSPYGLQLGLAATSRRLSGLFGAASMTRTSRMSSTDDLNAPVDPTESSDSPAKTDSDDRPRRRTDTLLLSTLRFVSALVSHSTIDIRISSSSCLPVLASSTCVETFENCLVPAAVRLSGDAAIAVRIALAGNIHQVFQTRYSKSASCAPLFPIVLKLLKDDDDAVAAAMLEHLDCILALVNENDATLRLTEFSAVMTHLVESLSRNALSHDWRRQLRLFHCMRLAHVLTDYSDTVVADIIAMCQQTIEVGVDPVRRSAVATLVFLSRFGTRAVVRRCVEEILSSLWRSPSWSVRCLGLYALSCSVWLFSKAYVKRTFLAYLPDLIKDPVSLVRERCLRALVGMRRWLTFPKDVQAITLLEDSAKLLFDDSNTRVAEAAKRAFTDINTFRDVIAGGSSHALVEEPAAGLLNSFGLKDLAEGLNHATMGAILPVDPLAWSIALRWARTYDESSDGPAPTTDPSPSDAFLSNPYFISGIAGLCPSLLASVPVCACTVSGSHNSSEETRRLAAEDALVAAGVREDEAENRRLLEERRAEVRTKGSRPKPPTGLQSILSSSVAVRGMKPSESKAAVKDGKVVMNSGATGILGSPTNGENRESFTAPFGNVCQLPSTTIVGDPRSKSTSDAIAGFASPSDSGFVLGLHRPVRGPRSVGSHSAARVRNVASDEGISSDVARSLMSAASEITAQTAPAVSTSASEPSGSLMPPIAGRRKVGVLGLSSKRSGDAAPASTPPSGSGGTGMIAGNLTTSPVIPSRSLMSASGRSAANGRPAAAVTRLGSLSSGVSLTAVGSPHKTL